jgi:signal transduction histidine kinase
VAEAITLEGPISMSSTTRKIAWLLASWVAFLAVYGAISLTHAHDLQTLSTFGNIVQCLVPLLANAGLLMNAGTPHWRRNVFWMLLAMSCTLWMTGQFEWTYYEVYLHKSLPNPYPGDIIFFLRGIPVMAALALRPHLKRGELRMRLGYLDFALLMTWWTYLYVFIVMPWIYASSSPEQYNFNFNVVTHIQNMVIVVSLAVLWLKASGAWRIVYANLFVATTLYLLSALSIDVASDAGKYQTGSLLDIPLITSFFWYGLTGWVAYQQRQGLDAPTENAFDSDGDASHAESVWATRLAMAAVISLPLFAIYTLRFGHEGAAVRDFRLMTTLVAAVPLALLVFLRTHLADADRVRLLMQSEHSIENLRRLQAQIVQSEKLVSLGQLAAGAAHEINNPLTAILGFSDLLADDPTLPEKARSTAAKIRDQARRTKTLVGNLLSFARQVPSERTLLDINTVVANAVQLRGMDLRSSNARIELQLESVLPGVRGDGNQLMQVFFNIISNAIDALEAHNGGILTVKTIRDRGNVVVLFSDNGPGLREPHRVFDPFYTTKPVGKGTGLGLSICFGIVQEHAGKIFCYNNQEGGAVFRVELPAVLAALPVRDATVAVASTTSSKP